MICIYTYYPFKNKESCGFLNTNELAIFLSLSVLYSGKQFKVVKLVTNNYGKSILIDKYGIKFTEVSTELEGLNFPPELWAFAKMHTYSLQTQPFIHLDCDVIIRQPLPTRIKNAALSFQNWEHFSVEKGYEPLIKAIEKTTVSYYCKSKEISYAFNCGIVIVNDLSIVKKWKQLVDEFIFNPANASFWNSQTNKEQFNYLFEQYFIACVAKDKYQLPYIGFLIDADEDITKPKFKMTHLWGKTKQSPVMDKIKLRLKLEYPRIYKRINNIEMNEVGVFDCLFEKGDKKYQALLRKTIKDKNIRSVVFLAWDNQHSKYLTLDGKKVDFLYSNDIKHIFPQCDLLIVKDAKKQWSGNDIFEFSKKKLSAKFVMDEAGVYQNKYSLSNFPSSPKV